MDKPKPAEKSRLGRGLSALIPPVSRAVGEGQLDGLGASAENVTGIREIPLAYIVPNSYQPRTEFDPEALDELVESVVAHGVLQPVLVRPRGGGRYELVAGERRYRAAEAANLETIPAVVREMSDEESLTAALIENIQREDLNAIEAARGYRRLLDQFHLTQTDLARQLGKAQPTIANALRLLRLPPAIQESIATGRITEEHGKALLTLSDEAKQEALWRDVIRDDLSVAETRRQAQRRGSGALDPNSKSAPEPVAKDVHWQSIEDQFRRALGLKVEISAFSDGRGTLRIHFSSAEEIEALLERLGQS